MNIEEYRNKRRNRLQKLNEKLSNMPELSDDKVHGEVDAVTADAIKTSDERDKLRKDSFKDKNKEVKEFIKKQDKDREVDSDDKSEKRLMLDESLFTEDADEFDTFEQMLLDGAKEILQSETDEQRQKGFDKARYAFEELKKDRKYRNAKSISDMSKLIRGIGLDESLKEDVGQDR